MIQKVNTTVVHRNEDVFVRKVLKKLGSTKGQQTECIRKEMTAIESRLQELDAKFDRLYDDRLEGFISDKKFKEREDMDMTM